MLSHFKVGNKTKPSTLQITFRYFVPLLVPLTATSYPIIPLGARVARPNPIHPVARTLTTKWKVSMLLLNIHDTLYVPPSREIKFETAVGVDVGGGETADAEKEFETLLLRNK